MKNKLEVMLDKFIPNGEQEEVDLKIFKQAARHKNNFTRDSLTHFTASAFILNSSHDKVLIIFHKIFNSWGWLGGHSDGNLNLVDVALKEAQEESGLDKLKVVSDIPISIEIIPVFSHMHRLHGYVPSHIHFNATFLFEADETEQLIINIEETNGISWVPINELLDKSTEIEMKKIYKKIISKIKHNEEGKI